MHYLTTLAALILSVSSVGAANCGARAVDDVLQPLRSDASYAVCQRDSNYTLLSLETPTLAQTSLLPDCNMILGALSFNLTDVMRAVSSKCAPAPKKFLSEYAVDKNKHQNAAQRTSDHITSIIGHSAPMDEVGNVGELAGALLSLLRRQ